MTRTCTLGPAAMQRTYFEKDQVFPESLAWLIDALEKAAERASHAARYAVLIPDDEHRNEALWFEAVAETLEYTLNAGLEGGEVEIPPSPKKRAAA